MLRFFFDGKGSAVLIKFYKPTIGETFRGVETYLFDFDGDLYGENIDVELWKFKRPEMKFDSVEHLKNQMQADIAFGKEYFFEK